MGFPRHLASVAVHLLPHLGSLQSCSEPCISPAFFVLFSWDLRTRVFAGCNWFSGSLSSCEFVFKSVFSLSLRPGTFCCSYPSPQVSPPSLPPPPPPTSPWVLFWSLSFSVLRFPFGFLYLYFFAGFSAFCSFVSFYGVYLCLLYYFVTTDRKSLSDDSSISVDPR